MAWLNKCLAGVAFATIGAASASADIVLFEGPGNFPNDENVLFNRDFLADNASTVQGITNQSSALVDFTNLSETLVTPSGGQARIEASDGSFTALKIALDTIGATFTTLIFNLDVVNSAGDGLLSITVNRTGESAVVFDSLPLDANGQNFFRLQAINGETIDSVSFVSDVALKSIKQVRIGGVSGAVAVPLPAAAFSGGALLAAAAIVRRIRRR